MRLSTRFAMVIVLLGAVACGGGAAGVPAGGNDTAGLVPVEGKLVTRDGASTGLDGVVVTCPETGRSDVTAADGSFRMDVPADRPFHLGFDDPAGPHHDDHPGDPGEHRDPHHDGAEIDGDGVTFRPEDRPDWCEVEVHLDDGVVVECHVRWGRVDGETHEGEGGLERDPLCDETGARGMVEFRLEDGCLFVEAEVDGFSGPATLDAYLVNELEEEAYVASIQVDADGVGHLEASWCEGDPLPFDAASVEDLAGYGIVVYDEDGAVVFRGHLPHHHAGDAGHHHGGGDPGGHHGGRGGPHHVR